ncbi:alpha/beta hydrolase [Marinicrinis sediminis]|uniref:Alpha/beta hydrolase n=1 Tax=Marinicrinis sediminis TaxID=1652465 RepID=A0ABW5RD64_9BACL
MRNMTDTQTLEKQPVATTTSTHGCLLIHGFTGGPYELEPLASRLSDHQISCVLPTLKGHEDRSLTNLRSACHADWLSEVEQAAKNMAQRYAQFDLIGFSMGGLLAAYAANRAKVRRLVLLNPAYLYMSPGRFARFVWSSFWKRDFTHFQKMKLTPYCAVQEFRKVVKQAKHEFDRIEVPTFVASSALDPIVHPMSGSIVYRRLKGLKHFHSYPNSGHLICWDQDAGQLAEDVLQFLTCPSEQLVMRS